MAKKLTDQGRETKITQHLTPEEYRKQLESEEKGDPIKALIRNYLVDEMPYPSEELENYEFLIKVQRITDDGKVIKGVGQAIRKLEDCLFEIGRKFGSGKFNLWVQYRPVGGGAKDWKMVQVADYEIEADNDLEPLDDGLPESGHTPAIDPVMLASMPRPQSAMEVQMNMMNLMFKTMMDRARDDKDMMLAMIERNSPQNGNGSAGSAEGMIDTFMKGIELGQRFNPEAGAVGGGEDDSFFGRIKSMLPLLPAVKEMLTPASTPVQEQPTAPSTASSTEPTEEARAFAEMLKNDPDMKAKLVSDPRTKRIVDQLEDMTK